MLGHELAITWPIWLALKWKKMSPYYTKIAGLWPILHRTHCTPASLTSAWADGGFPLPGIKIILTLDICNHKKKRQFIIVLFKWRWEKFNLLLYKSSGGCLQWKKQRKSICELWHQTTFRNTTIYWIYNNSSPCKWPGPGCLWIRAARSIMEYASTKQIKTVT